MESVNNANHDLPAQTTQRKTKHNASVNACAPVQHNAAWFEMVALSQVPVVA